MNRRFTSIAYGLAGGAALVDLGAPILAVIVIGLMAGMGSELYRGYKESQTDDDQ